ncbi:ComF family protein [Vibrio maerlii]|uniref:ComF family protein n=1 Tax=Vibrio maerlii TaxID=2231648 RepID=UPI000E3BADE2|nr:phosphoribosyltransferase family protein [Vibrio maerlii]
MNFINRIWQHCASQCQLCGLTLSDRDQHSLWCNDCIEHAFPQQSRCSQCGLKTSIPLAQCGECLKSPPPWRTLTCIGDYHQPLSGYVQQLKYHDKLHFAEVLSPLLAEKIGSPATLITSVPMRWRRYLWRGYNHSHILAKHLHRQFVQAGIDCQYQRLFTRVKATPTQQGLNKQARLSNLNQAFLLRKEALAHIKNHEHVAIVDDVVTTGSTTRQLCQLLLEVGVKTIDIYCLCRTPEPSS